MSVNQAQFMTSNSTPPPPPPKPANHSVSGISTPLAGPPRPPPPEDPANAAAFAAGGDVNSEEREMLAIVGPEDGWLPDSLRDKSYAPHAPRLAN
jgi:hypothetical protein